MRHGLFSKQFWEATGERAVKSLAQGLLATLGTAGLGTVGVLHVDWVGVLSVGAGTGILSVLTSLASVTLGQDGPSLGPEALTAPSQPSTGRHSPGQAGQAPPAPLTEPVTVPKNEPVTPAAPDPPPQQGPSQQGPGSPTPGG